MPVGTLVVLAVRRLVAETYPKLARLDVVGALTATLGSVALVYGFISVADSGWAYFGTILSFVAALALFIVFVRTEMTHTQPLLDLRLLQDRSRVGGLAVMALIVGVHFSRSFILVQYLQRACATCRSSQASPICR